MPLRYKMDIVKALKEKGYNTNTIRKNQYLSESTMTKLRAGIGLSWDNIEKICSLLDCQPGDFIEFTRDKNE